MYICDINIFILSTIFIKKYNNTIRKKKNHLCRYNE